MHVSFRSTTILAILGGIILVIFLNIIIFKEMQKQSIEDKERFKERKSWSNNFFQPHKQGNNDNLKQITSEPEGQAFNKFPTNNLHPFLLL
jgi:hypothetical protein